MVRMHWAYYVLAGAAVSSCSTDGPLTRVATFHEKHKAPLCVNGAL